SSYFIRSYSWEVVATRSSPTYTSQKGLQPWRCLLKRGTGVMVMEWMRRGLLWGMMGSSAIMSHMYSMYLHMTHTHTHTHTHIHTQADELYSETDVSHTERNELRQKHKASVTSGSETLLSIRCG